MFSRKTDKWYKIALKLYKRGKLEEPYNSLFDYYINMTVDYPSKEQCLNHYIYFSHYKQEGLLKNLCANLTRILPVNLKDNFEIALEKFEKITDYDAEENYDLFEKEDDYVDDNAEVLKNILENYINSL